MEIPLELFAYSADRAVQAIYAGLNLSQTFPAYKIQQAEAKKSRHLKAPENPIVPLAKRNVLANALLTAGGLAFTAGATYLGNNEAAVAGAKISTAFAAATLTDIAPLAIQAGKDFLVGFNGN